MHRYLTEMLICPACHGGLNWRVDQQSEDRIESAEAHCIHCAASYPVREGIGLFLTPDLPRNDLWEQVDSGLVRHLQDNPDLEHRLMDVPLETLNPTDQFFRTLMLEAEGKYNEVKVIQESAFPGMYTPDYLDCWNSQIDYVVSAVSATTGPIVDLASGRGYLVETLIRKTRRLVIATDFSPGVLRRNRRWLESIGLYDRVTLLAFDARRTPFKDGAVQTLTTNLGLPNIEEPGNLLKELRRIVSGLFLAVSQFYPVEDQANAKVIHDAGLEKLLYRQSTLVQFAEAGWQVILQNKCLGQARPTPPSDILEGVRIDGLPVADTLLEWCVIKGDSKGFPLRRLPPISED
ncbi:MAG: methyltransferase domain-containing protein [Candidatus Promineifilaceae bacterium]